jgi:hypothetical protein
MRRCPSAGDAALLPPCLTATGLSPHGHDEPIVADGGDCAPFAARWSVQPMAAPTKGDAAEFYGYGAAAQFQVAHVGVDPSVKGRFHSPDSHTWPPAPMSGSGVAPE